MWRALPAQQPATPAADQPQATPAVPPEVELRITNGSGGPVTVVAIRANEEQVPLGELGPGESYALPAYEGTVLGFATDGAWVGDAYIAGSAAVQIVAVPHAAPPAAAIPAGGEGLLPVTLTIRNDSAGPVMVIALDASGGQQPLFEVGVGASYDQPAFTGARLAFAQGGGWLGDPYEATADPRQSMSVPYAAPAQIAAPVVPPGGAGLAAVSVTITNGSDGPITVIALDASGGQEPLFEVEPGQTYDQPAFAGARLAFAQGDDWLGDPYVATSDPRQSMSVPYAAPAQIAAPVVPPGGAGLAAVSVTITNGSDGPVTVIALDDNDGQQPLFEVGPGESYAQPAFAGARLAFAQGGGWLGDPYMCTAESQQAVSLPYTAPAQQFSIDDIDVKTVAADIVADIVRQQIEARNDPVACWKTSYGRGVGKIPTFCAAGMEDVGGLCYPTCRSGFTGFVTMCVPTCRLASAMTASTATSRRRTRAPNIPGSSGTASTSKEHSDAAPVCTAPATACGPTPTPSSTRRVGKVTSRRRSSPISAARLARRTRPTSAFRARRTPMTAGPVS